MVVFWIAAAGLAGGAAALVILLARQGAGRSGAESPTLSAHRRQLAEIEELAERGLLNPEDQAATRAEAARRLLSSAALGEAPEASGSRRSRLVVAALGLAAGAAALGLYVWLGSPGLADQPYQGRLAAWRKADPATLDAAQMAAVLSALAKDRPNDPQVYGYLGRAELAAGDPWAAEKAFARAAALAPGRADFQVLLGETLMDASGDKPPPEAADAFRRALALEPGNLIARYSLGRVQILSGDRTRGVAEWRGMLASLSPTDPRRGPFQAQIDRVAGGGPIEEAAPSASPEGGGAAVFIRSMVASLAAKLASHPDDPDGWARLVRSYGVLHDRTAQGDALARARKRFAARPDLLRPIEAEARDHPA